MVHRGMMDTVPPVRSPRHAPPKRASDGREGRAASLWSKLPPTGFKALRLVLDHPGTTTEELAGRLKVTKSSIGRYLGPFWRAGLLIHREEEGWRVHPSLRELVLQEVEAEAQREAYAALRVLRAVLDAGTTTAARLERSLGLSYPAALSHIHLLEREGFVATRQRGSAVVVEAMWSPRPPGG